MGRYGKFLGYVYMGLACFAIIPAALGGTLTEQLRDQLQLLGISLTFLGLGIVFLLSSHDRR